MSDEEVKETKSEPEINPASTEKVEGKPKKKGRFIIIGALAVVIILLVVVIWLLLRKESPDQRDTVVTKDNVGEIQNELNKQPVDSYYVTSMTIDWTFDTATAISKDAVVDNVTNNTRTVYFDVFLKDTNEKVYSSPYIPVGSSLNEIALTTELPAGDHPAVVTYYLVDEENKVITDVSVAITLHILQ